MNWIELAKDGVQWQVSV